MKLFLKRLLLIIIGIFFSLIVLECGLRLTGLTVSFYKQYKNDKILKNKSKYTIMCLGESTTDGQYPKQLQQMLNEKYPNKFSVIDCGIYATKLEIILSLLDDNINKYKPDIAICMMGINNGLTDFLHFINIENNDYIKKSKNINFKFYKLFL
ncbi:MAG: hypothetical protein IKN42_07750, partial [Elusimicrobia bacterium]|nr:hypothetical protein [Elusimicrobiota bacterium]